jgi:hypothetical protein
MSRKDRDLPFPCGTDVLDIKSLTKQENIAIREIATLMCDLLIRVLPFLKI